MVRVPGSGFGTIVAVMLAVVASAASAQAPGGRISGRVVAAQTGQPLQQAIVTLNGSQVQRVTTDADGRYEFTGLPGGTFSVRAGKSGYVTLQYGQRRSFEPGTPVALATGQRVDAIDLSLPRGAVIAVRLTDALGEPVAGAQIQLQRFRYSANGDRMLTNLGGSDLPSAPLTDDRGEARAHGLPAGEYILSALFRPLSGEPTFYPGTLSGDGAQPIAVIAGQEALAQFALLSPRLARVAGTVADSQGRPATRAQVQLFRFAAGSGLITSVMVSPDGTFSIPGVPPGSHHIEVSTADGELASMPAAINGVDVTGLHLITSAGATISGRVVFDGSSPPALKSPLRVLPDQVQPGLRAMPGATSSDVTSNGTVDAAGRFRLAGVVGRVLLRAAAAGWVMKSLTLKGRVITDEPLDMPSGASVTDVVITLTDRLTTIAGRVADAQGAAPRLAVVAIVPAAQPGPAPARTWPSAIIRPNAEGRFEVRGMRPGRYLASAFESLEEGAQFAPGFQDRLRRGGREFTVGEGQAVTLDLRLSPDQ